MSAAIPTLGAEQAAAYRRDGFLRIEALAGREETAALRDACESLFRREGVALRGDRLELNADTARAPLPQVVNPERHAPSLVQGAAYANASAIARELLGAGCVSTGNHAILKPARIGGETPWHQDEAYWDSRFVHHALSVWLALQPSTVENGCMQFLAGSHRGEVLPHALISPDSHGLRLAVPLPAGSATTCELPAGGATLHDGRTLHRAGANRSGAPRLALVFGFGLPPVASAAPPERPWQRPEWFGAAGG